MKKVLFTLLSQIPLGGAAAIWFKELSNQPWLAIVFVLLYELFVFVLVFGRKVWTQLEPQAVAAVAEWVKVSFLNLFSGFRRRYNKQVIYEYRVFNIRGLKTVGTYTLKLEKVFVELRIAPAHLQQAGLNPTAFREMPGSAPVWEFLRRMKSQDAVALALIGPPGCGKTTLLQHIALTLATNKQNRFGFQPFSPLFLLLREHAQLIERKSPNLAQLAQQHFLNTERYPGLKPPPDWFERHLRKGKLLILLDGLDEVADKKQREKISLWLDKQIRAYPRCFFVVSSRPGGYRDAPLSHAHILEVLPFNYQQTSRFIHNWYLANKIISYGKDDPGVRLDAKRNANDLLGRLRTQPGLSVLTVNPLLLTMVAMVHNYRGALPGRRVELYAEICDVMLGHWRKARGIEDSLTPAQKRKVLQPLASHMMNLKGDQEKRTISAQEALEIISPNLEKVGLDTNLVPNFLEDVQACSGLFLEKEPDRWSFAHLTFQEYLCARHWHESGEAALWGKEKWSTLIDDTWWHETLRLYSAQADATPLVKACLQSNTVNSLTLAAELEEEAFELEHSLRGKLNLKLEEDLESEVSERFQLAANVFLNRRIKGAFKHLDEKRSIDKHPITCAEYQLFIDYMRAQEKYFQPDHWVSSRFPKGMARQPIVGIRYNDAAAFCDWLTQTTGATFRLPFSSEIAVLPVDSECLLAFWTQPNSLEGPVPLRMADFYKMESGKEKIIPLPPFIDLSLASALESDLLNALLKVLASEIASALHRASALESDLHHALDSARAREIALDNNRVLTSASALARALDRARDSDLALDRALDIARESAHAVDRARDRTRDSARDLHRASANALARDLDRALVSVLALTRDSARTLALALTCASALESDSDIDRARDSARDLHRALDRDSASDIVLPSDLSFVLALDNARASDIALVLARDSARALASILESVNDISFAISLSFAYQIYMPPTLAIHTERYINNSWNDEKNIKNQTPLVSEALNSIDFKIAKCLIDNISSTRPQINSSSKLNLISAAVNMIEAKTFSQLRIAIREFSLRQLEYVYQKLSPFTNNKQTKGILSRKKRRPKKSSGELEEKLTANYWFLRIIQEREKGNLPAYEGIRIVREYKE